MRVFRYLLKKEFLQLSRDRKMLPLIFVAPIVQLVLLGFAANLDVRHLSLAVLDREHSARSRELVDAFVQTDYFQLTAIVESSAEAEELLVRGEVAVVLSIPNDLSRRLAAGETAPLQLLVDGTNSVVGTAVLNYAAIIVQGYARANAVAPLRVVPRVWYNPEMESRNFMVPGILAMLLMLVTMVLSSLAIVKEKELGTLEQLNVTPITPGQMVVGKLFPFLIIGIVDIVLVLVVARSVFHVPFRGSVVLLFFASILFLASTLGLGLLVSTISDNQQQAMLTASFFVMIPMFFLSGFAFPIESMPPPIRVLTYLFPLRYYLVIIRGIFLKGAGIPELWEQIVALAVFGAMILSVASIRFRKRTS